MESETAIGVIQPKYFEQIEHSIPNCLNALITASDPELSDKQRLLRKTIGKTNRSPFLWAIGDQSCNQQFSSAMNSLHRHFWQVEVSDGELIAGQFADHDLEKSLLAVALSAYGFDCLGQFLDEDEHIALADRPLLSQLWFVELPLWRIAKECEEYEPVSLIIHRFECLIGECLDTDGWPESKNASQTGLLVASWCRTIELLKYLGKQVNPETFSVLCELRNQLLRLKRRDGSLLFAETAGGLNCNSFKKSIQRNLSDSFLRRLRHGKKNRLSERLPAASSISEWGQIGVLQSSWKAGCPKVGIAFGDKKVALDICHGLSLVAGECTPELIIDGRPANVISEIGVSAYLKVDKGDLIELEIEYEEAVVQRQILFLSSDKLLFVNDVVCCRDVAELQYSSKFSLCDGIEIVRETESNEFYLKNNGRFSLVMPLAMPEWKLQQDRANVLFEDRQFIVSKTITGRGLSFPVVFDLDFKRSLQPRTWRRLTVAEAMKPVGDDMAAAYRVQIGKEQWLFYRSISSKGNRTFLGQNYADEFLVGKIDQNGEVKRLVEIE